MNVSEMNEISYFGIGLCESSQYWSLVKVGPTRWLSSQWNVLVLVLLLEDEWGICKNCRISLAIVNGTKRRNAHCSKDTMQNPGFGLES